jgi:hypothetical protein
MQSDCSTFVQHYVEHNGKKLDVYSSLSGYVIQCDGSEGIVLFHMDAWQAAEYPYWGRRFRGTLVGEARILKPAQGKCVTLADGQNWKAAAYIGDCKPSTDTPSITA